MTKNRRGQYLNCENLPLFLLWHHCKKKNILRVGWIKDHLSQFYCLVIKKKNSWQIHQWLQKTRQKKHSSAVTVTQSDQTRNLYMKLWSNWKKPQSAHYYEMLHVRLFTTTDIYWRSFHQSSFKMSLFQIQFSFPFVLTVLFYSCCFALNEQTLSHITDSALFVSTNSHFK